ncbi:Sip1-related alpha-galactosidase, partial [Pseudomonas syringae]
MGLLLSFFWLYHSLSEGSTPPRFVIIDDGWQQIGIESK